MTTLPDFIRPVTEGETVTEAPAVEKAGWGLMAADLSWTGFSWARPGPRPSVIKWYLVWVSHRTILPQGPRFRYPCHAQNPR